MSKYAKLLASLVVFGSLHGSPQDLPKNENRPVPETVDAIKSVDGRISLDSKKWWSVYEKPELGIIAEPAGGWLNHTVVSDMDCEAAFQVLDGDAFADGHGLHDWLKFPDWSHITIAKERLGELDVVGIGRTLPNRVFDRIYIAGDKQGRLIVVRFITYNRTRLDRARKSAVEELIERAAGDSKVSRKATADLAKSVSPPMFVVHRDVPASVEEAVQRLVKNLAPVEREHLLKNMGDATDLWDDWPIVDGEVPRLHWMIVYWGLNDPTSPIRRDMGKPPDLNNGDYVLEVLTRAEKELRENPTHGR